MKHFIVIIVLSVLVSMFANAAMCFDVKPVGKTTIKFNKNSYIAIKSVERTTPTNLIDIWKAGKVSMIELFEITINNKEVVVPWSTYSDLFAVSKATINKNNKGYILTLWGGDGAAPYKVDIYFDNKSAIRRVLSAGKEKMVVTEETLYRW